LSIKPDNAEDIREVRNRIKKIAEETPGVSTEVFTFLSERIKELLAGTPAALAVQVQGESLKDLEETTRQIETTLNGIKGRDHVRVEPQTGAAEMVVHIRSDDAARFGFKRLQVLEAVQTAFQGAEVGQVYQGPRTIDLRVLIDEKHRRDLLAIKSLPLTAPPPEKNAEPVRIPLEKVANVDLKGDSRTGDGRFLIAHEAGLRRPRGT